MIHTPKNNRMKQEEIRLLFQRFEQMACVSGDVDVLPSMPETDSSATTKVTIDKSHLIGEQRYSNRLTYDGRWENNL